MLCCHRLAFHLHHYCYVCTSSPSRVGGGLTCFEIRIFRAELARIALCPSASLSLLLTLSVSLRPGVALVAPVVRFPSPYSSCRRHDPASPSCPRVAYFSPSWVARFVGDPSIVRPSCISALLSRRGLAEPPRQRPPQPLSETSRRLSLLRAQPLYVKK